MQEVKRPKLPLFFYYAIVIAVILLLNMIIVPYIAQRQVIEVDYGTFMSMADEKNIGKAQVEDNQILFTDKAGDKVFKTGRMDDPDLNTRLYEAGAEYGSPIVEEASPLMSFIFTWVLPILIFWGLGQLMSKKLMDKMGGGNSMMFNMGKSSAKVYVKSSDGI